MPSLVAERIESVKSGLIGAGTFAIAESLFILGNFYVASTVANYPEMRSILTVASWQTLFQLAVGAVSGFLFGVTYRYVIRDDRNFHLNDGAVLAFGLVRGLALIEGNLEPFELLTWLFFICQSIICFAIARSALDLALARKLIKPFV